jgi:uncharacterized paraquat-inducible protein A
MAISTSCPQCGATLQFDDLHASRQGSCPSCGTTFTIATILAGIGFVVWILLVISLAAA